MRRLVRLDERVEIAAGPWRQGGHYRQVRTRLQLRTRRQANGTNQDQGSGQHGRERKARPGYLLHFRELLYECHVIHIFGQDVFISITVYRLNSAGNTNRVAGSLGML